MALRWLTTGGQVILKITGRTECLAARIPNDRAHPVNDVQPPANFPAARKRSADADRTANGLENCEHDQRHPHRFWRLVRCMRLMPGRWMILVRLVSGSVFMRTELLFSPESHRDP